jgi:acetyl-CoA synthetase
MLLDEVCRFAAALKLLDLKPGDRATIYMPMVPEVVIAMLACARIGVVHSVVFGGFSADAVADRTVDAGARIVITSDGGWRRGKAIPLKDNVDKALERCPNVEKCIVLRRTGQDISMTPGRDIWWHDLVNGVKAHCEPEILDAEHPLFLLYTSGSTGKPKGILHTTGGYLLGASYSHRLVFDLKENDVYWCTADVGWITGHSYVVYGPLCNGATVMIYEGAPDAPAKDRFWDIIERHRVNIFYTAPTAIRAFIKWGDEFPDRHDLSSLRVLGTVGEPINPEAWLWFHEKIGNGRCPIVDTWWQTETGMIMIAPLPGAIGAKPGSATLPLPGIVADIVDKHGNSVGTNEGGLLVIRQPWPSMLRTPDSFVSLLTAPDHDAPQSLVFSGDSLLVQEADLALPSATWIGRTAAPYLPVGLLDGVYYQCSWVGPDYQAPPGMEFRKLRSLFGKVDDTLVAGAWPALLVPRLPIDEEEEDIHIFPMILTYLTSSF